MTFLPEFRNHDTAFVTICFAPSMPFEKAVLTASNRSATPEAMPYAGDELVLDCRELAAREVVEECVPRRIDALDAFDCCRRCALDAAFMFLSFSEAVVDAIDFDRHSALRYFVMDADY